jgi:S1-C subfamily serine protease
MNLIDAAAAVVVILGLALGYRSGAVRQLGGLVGAVAGVGVVLILGTRVAESMSDVDPLVRVVAVAGALALGVIAGHAVGTSLGARIADGREEGFVGASNRIAGSLIGLAEAVVLVWLIGGLIAMAPDPQLARLAQRSTAVQTLAAVAPPPASVVDGIQEQLAASGLPQLFDGIAPLPANPVELPSGNKARALAETAAPSTVKVVSTGCGGQGVGSGVAVSPGYVVTNAHVVAGGDLVQVQSSGRSFEAIPVKIDSDLDVALLYSPSLDAPALAFSREDPDRGDVGVALGYPGGGPLKAIRASVNREILANGRDVYGDVPVTREVLELNARVNPGNSGGPLVMSDGTIGGIVFAESPSDPRVGYALAAEDVSAALSSAIGRTSPVRTGACQN